MMKAQQQEIAKRDARIAELEKIIQKLLSEQQQQPMPSAPPSTTAPSAPLLTPMSKTNPANKSEPMFKISDFANKN